MKTCISAVGLVLCLAIGAIAQSARPYESRRDAARTDPLDSVFNTAEAQMNYDLVHQSQSSPIQSSAQSDLTASQRTTVSVKELQHKIPASALKEDSKGMKA